LNNHAFASKLGYNACLRAQDSLSRVYWISYNVLN